MIDLLEDQLLTSESEAVLRVLNGNLQADVENDILKIAVVERYGHNHIANGFVKGFKILMVRSHPVWLMIHITSSWSAQIVKQMAEAGYTHK